MNNNLRDFIDLVQFIENVSLRIHGLRTQQEIFEAIGSEFKQLNKYAMAIMMQSEDGTGLQMEVSTIPRIQKLIARKIFGFDIDKYRVDLKRSSLLNRVMQSSETVIFSLSDMLCEMFPNPLIQALLSHREIDNRQIIATPVHIGLRTVGLFSISLPRMTEDFEPTVRFFAQHLSTALELAEEHTRRIHAQRYEDFIIDILDLLNNAHNKKDAIRHVLLIILSFAGFDSAAVRLKIGEDYPLFDCIGMADELKSSANSLCRCNSSEQSARDNEGMPIDECLCSKIISGKTDPMLPYFTQGGGFWTNSITDLIASGETAASYAKICAQCSGAATESIAIIPLKFSDCAIGLLQIFDRRKNAFTKEMIHWFEGICHSMGAAIARMEAEESLRDEKERSQRYLHLAGTIFLALDNNGNVTLANRKACEVLGCEGKDIVGKNWFHTFLPESLRAQTYEYFKNIMAGNAESAPSHENPVISSDGKEHIIQWNNTLLIDSNGALSGVLSAGEDITERKRADEERRNLEQQYHQAHKMEAIGQLAGGVAHDLNNMLGAILGYAEMIQVTNEDAQGMPVNSDLDKKAATIIEATNRAANLVGQLLAFSRQGKYQNVHIDVHRSVKEVIKLLQHSIDKRIKVTQNLRAEIPIINGDPSQLHNALLNLAVNARDAMPDGGELHFETTLIDLDNNFIKLRSWDLSPGRYVCISVIDTGTGMDLKTKEHIFEPFFTTKGPGKGTGLGLASVFGTMRNHNGFVDVQSEPGHGSSFRIYLPCASEFVREEQPAEQPAIAHGKGTVMIVDDEETIGMIAMEMLAASGYDAAYYTSSSAALEHYKHNYSTIDLVILDMIMPDMTGCECFNELKKINPGVKSIISTGYSINEDIEKALQDGVLAVIHKPFDRRQICEAVSNAINNSRHLEMAGRP